MSRARPSAGLIVFYLLISGTARAQQSEPPLIEGAILDPASPMAPLPDLGVEWPDPIAPPEAERPAPPVAAQPAPGAARTTVRRQAAAAAKEAGEQRYTVRLAGTEALGEAHFRERFDAVSALVLQSGEPANVAQIDRRAREDAETLNLLLRAEGYYDGEVDTAVAAENGRIVVTLTVRPGPQYHFSAVTISGLDALPGPVRGSFAVKAGDAVDADAVTTAATALKTALGHAGYSYANVADPDITVDHDARTATLKLAVAPGEVQRLGRFVVEGRQLFSPDHLAIISRVRPGEPLDAARIDDLRRALIATGLVSTVQLTPTATADPGVSDLAVRLERAPRRTIAGELGYGTGEGARTEISWTHRNLIRPEGAVTFRGALGTQEQLIGASLRQGNFRQRDQVLNAQIVASHTQRDAYDARTFTLSANLERQTNIIWQKKWTWTFGGELIASDERDVLLSTGLPRRRTYFIAAAPTGLAYDGTDDLLNPSRGYRLSGRFSPEVSLRGKPFTYGRTQIDGSAYLPWGDRVVFAGRFRFGSILGTGRDDIAPSRRFYVGGGGSVRGYGYQDVGPRDGNNDPVGGRSLNEFSLETRIRFGDFGVVPFLDAGNLYTSALPRFTGLRYGAGLGARYYTSFGPIRVDLGTPINPQRGDPRLAVYVSLGQAF
ncbi:autotransporter assembly complex protein TamA [Sphingomonas quercus]|uniref:BamA/TamA family outer membrane protein n=1 Tax=Sphingomonas quercus TaxID=2842451 RepID=A0ABS6BJ15_9SPHN|nr:BamA/TamA family outer membrane protein [Sphingomonas quercus]MBU3077421.1 BamA/TamA family outer membrane protein [Sphingomonas quercus]